MVAPICGRSLLWTIAWVLTLGRAVHACCTLQDTTVISCAGCGAGATSIPSLLGLGITAVAPDAFASNTALVSLSLNSNKLVSLPAGLFANNIALRSLELANNQLTSLPAGMFTNNTALRYLNIRSNQLATLPLGVFATNKQLETVHCDGNFFSQQGSCAPGEFSSTQTFVNLDLLVASWKVCDKCTAGSYCTGVDGLLQNCPAGTFSSTIGASDLSVCLPCPAGTFNDLFGRASFSACTPCLAGFASIVSGASSFTSCIPCSLGFFAVGGQRACAPCGPGWYAIEGHARDGPSACVACERGRYSNATAATSPDT